MRKIHAEEIYGEFTVDVMEFVFILSISLIEMFWLHIFKIVEIVRTFRVHTLMQDKKLPVLFGDESIPAVRAAQLYRREAVILLGELRVTDLTGELSLTAVVLVKILLWSLTTGTGTVIGDVTFGPPFDGTDLLFVTFFKVRDQFLISPVLTEIGDQREFINLVFLVFRGMGVIKRPLFEWDESADKI